MFAEPLSAASTWDSEYCKRQEGPLCKDAFEVQATEAIANPFATYDDSATPGSLFGNCTKASEQAAVTMQAAVLSSCNACKDKCRHWMALDLKQYLKPATAAVFCVLIFVLLTIVVNDLLVSDFDRWVFLPLLGYVMCDGFSEASFLRCNVYGLNALTGASGIGMFVASYMGNDELQARCPANGDCSNAVVTAIGVIGLLLAALGVGGLVSINLPAPTLGKLVLRIVNFAYSGLGFLLLLCGVFCAIISGGVESTQAATDDNFDEVRAGYEAQDANFCKVDGVAMTDTECREKIVADVESTLLVLAVFGFLLASGMVAVMYVTLRAIKSMKGTTLVEKIVDVVDDVVPVSDQLQRCQKLGTSTLLMELRSPRRTRLRVIQEVMIEGPSPLVERFVNGLQRHASL
jgi:hypothetical protein